MPLNAKKDKKNIKKSKKTLAFLKNVWYNDCRLKYGISSATISRKDILYLGRGLALTEFFISEFNERKYKQRKDRYPQYPIGDHGQNCAKGIIAYIAVIKHEKV